jgi:hypothetical protein
MGVDEQIVTIFDPRVIATLRLYRRHQQFRPEITKRAFL